MAFLGGIFGGGQKAQPISIDSRTPQRQQIDSFLADFVSKYGGQYQPGQAYGGSFTAPLGGFEKQGLDQFLAQYLNQGVSSQTGDVQTLLNKTVNGGFDPGTSDYYQALRNTAGYNRDQAIKNTNADLGARNKFFSSEAVQKYGDINAQTANSLNTTMADLADKERTRSMGAVAPAVGLEQYLAGIPLAKAGAATTIGAIPRQLAQSDLEAQYQDFIRKQKELGAVTGAASGVSNSKIEQGYANPTLQSGDTGLLSFLGPLLGSSAGQGAMASVGGALSGAGASLAQFLPMLLGFCWVAAEVFGGWSHPKTEACRYYIGEMAPARFRDLYMRHGEKFAAFIKDKPILKAAIRPLFELFAVLGERGMEACNGIA